MEDRASLDQIASVESKRNEIDCQRIFSSFLSHHSHNTKTTHMSITSVIIAALIGSAADFTPAHTAKPSTQLRASAATLGVQPPVGFFDPFLLNPVPRDNHAQGGDFCDGCFGFGQDASDLKPRVCPRSRHRRPARPRRGPSVLLLARARLRHARRELWRRGRVYLINKGASGWSESEEEIAEEGSKK
jgi:hypothetical protein